MSDQVIYLNTRGSVRHALLVVPVALALLGAWFFVRWYIGDTIAEYLTPDDRALQTAQIAAQLAPDDPLAHWQLAEALQRSLPQDQLGPAIKEYEAATRLAPHDYRFWLALGRALEQAGDTSKGEKAMRHAVNLAPAYAYPHWYLGNLLLRSGQEAEAFDELRRASESDAELRPQIFSLAWQVYSKDFDALKRALGPTAERRAEFAKYLIGRKEFDAALRAWNDLNAAEKTDNHAAGDSIMTSLLEAKRFRQALTVWNDLAANEGARGRVEQLIDGGFEQASDGKNVFGWQIKSVTQAQAAFDRAVHHGASQSLRLQFQVRSNLDFSNVSQLVVIEPGTQYELECFVKTRDLQSASTPVIQVLDAVDNALLAGSRPVTTGDNDWQPISLAFKAGPKTEAVIIRLSRAQCEDATLCPIFGSLWCDDFNLKRKG